MNEDKPWLEGNRSVSGIKQKLMIADSYNYNKYTIFKILKYFGK